MKTIQKPIGIFDSGFGGLTILKELHKKSPRHSFLYLGDNARTPYGTRSFESVYHYTKQAVRWLFDQGCPLVILACNTASAKALRTIQQKDLPQWEDGLRVLGVIRPTTEVIGNYTKTQKVGILATNGTVKSGSYPIEIAKFYPDIEVYQQSCPLWVPLIENDEWNTAGGAYFIQKNIKQLLNQNSDIDTVLLGCTHYPLIEREIRKYLPKQIQLITQGQIIASSLEDYLQRHQDINSKCLKDGNISFFTTDNTRDFNIQSGRFFGKEVQSTHIDLEEYWSGRKS